MKQRIFAALLACALLTGCGAVRTAPVVMASTEEDGRVRLAYVPLDDRPDNVSRVVYLAESLDYRLVMPEENLYKTRLDHQPAPEGRQCGDPWLLYQWVLEQEAEGCDRYILSLDQLLSGGLVNSRCESSQVIIKPDGETVSVTHFLTELLLNLAADPNNQVWLLESVMRLAPTVGYGGGTLEDYNSIRAFGMEPRKTLAGDALNIPNIVQNYWLDPAGENLYDKQYAQEPDSISFEALAQNMEARERKLTLSGQTQDILSGPGYLNSQQVNFDNFHLLIGIDDSSAEECIQKNEIAFLRQNLRTDADGKPLDWLLSGVDDLAFKAVARMYLDETGWQGAKASVRYFGGSENEPACAYDFQPLTEIMEEHFAFFDLTEDADAAAVDILVLTQPADETKKETYYQQLIQDLQACREAHRPVVLIDAGNGLYGTAFHDALVKRTELGYLISYAGFLDMAIVTGTALSHGVARLAVLQQGGGNDGMEYYFAKTLTDSVIKDFCYKNIVRNDILTYVRNDLGGNPDNFWNPCIQDRLAPEARLHSLMEAATPEVVKNLERSNLLTSLKPDGHSGQPAWEERGWGGILLSDYHFPWDRAFEMDMEIRLGAFTEPHKNVLGIYYQ